MATTENGIDLDVIRKINKTVINPDGTIKSFKEQLLEYEYGYYNATLPFIVLPTSAPLMQAGAKDYPITMAPGILRKLMHKHGVYPRDIAELPKLIQDSNVLMLDSYTYPHGGLCMYLEERGSNDVPLFAAFHLDRMAGRVSVNEFLSIYERSNIEFTIIKTWEKGLNLYPNEKTKSWIQSLGLQLPGEVSSLLDGNYRSISKDKRVSLQDIISKPQVKGNTQEAAYSLRSASESARASSEALSGQGDRDSWLSRSDSTRSEDRRH